MKKLLEAIPNSLIVIGAIAAVGLLLSPFLMEMFGGRPKTGGVTLNEDSENLPGLEEKSRKRARSTELLPEAKLLNHYAGITLEQSPAQLQQRFPVHVVSRPQANPQLYEARNTQGFDYFRATFYDDKLKEFVVIYPPRSKSPEDVAKELFDEFGEVPAWLRGREEEAARIGGVTTQWVEVLMAYPTARQLAWSDGDNRIDATIYSRTDSDNQPQSILAVQVSAPQWIKDYKAKQESGIAAPLPEKTKPEGGVTEPSGPVPGAR